MKLDPLDKEILRELQKDAKQSSKKLGKKFGKPQTTIVNRIKRLENMGIIKGYAAIIDAEKIGLGATAFSLIKVKQGPIDVKAGKGAILEATKNFAKYEEVNEVYALAGDYDILLKIHGESEKAIGKWLMTEFWKVSSVDKSSTIITFYSEKDTQNLKII